MKLKQWIWMMVGLVLALGLVGCGGAPKVDWTLEVTGGSTPVTLSYADLVDMPQTDLKDVLMQKSLGEDRLPRGVGRHLRDFRQGRGDELQPR
jgi:hypothetical protein